MKRTRILIAVILAVTSLGVYSSLKSQNTQKSTIHLNSTLKNSMSQIEGLTGMDQEIKVYLNKWNIKGASLAIMRNDSLVYAKGYGWADKDAGVRMDVGHIMRVASVSKLITAIGIMVLQDQGKITIKDKVFGPTGVLYRTYMNSLAKDPLYKELTIEHLLRHEGGYRRDAMFSSLTVKSQMNLTEAPTADDFIKYTLPRKLDFVPGTSQKYSNFSYLLLSRIIETVSGMSYEKFIKEYVLKPAGCFDMHIAGNYLEDKRTNEVHYYAHGNLEDRMVYEFNGSGNKVDKCYGGNNITVLSGAAAWCASPVELARLVASVDGRDEVPDIISKEAFEQMTEYFTKEKFSLGWNDTNPEKGWNRTGTFTGTSALVKYYPNNECWIMITNTSTWKGSRLTKVTDSLFRKCSYLYGHELPKRNLFD
jgi:CubicO group peptidase (beta-lactamase class C family)